MQFIVNSTIHFVKPVVTTVIYLVYNKNCVTVNGIKIQK